MRHAAGGRHRSRPRIPLRSYLLAAMAVLAAVLSIAGLSGSFSARAATGTAVIPAANLSREVMSEPASASVTATRIAVAAVREQARQAAAMRAAANAAAALAARTYTVRAGQSMSGIALAKCHGQARMWTGIYAASRQLGWTARNANNLTAGQHLYLNCTYVPSMLRFAPAPPPPPPAPVRAVAAVATASTGHGYPSPAARRYSAPAATYSAAAGSYQQCVITRESGGNSQVMNSSGHYGLYQFDYRTWVSGGGSGADFGHASVAEQNRVFAAVYAARGTQPWSPSDGC